MASPSTSSTKEKRRQAAEAASEGGRTLAELKAKYEFESTIGWLFHDIHRVLTKGFERRATKLGITRAQWRVVMAARRVDGLTQTELADLVDMEKAPCGRLLDKLEKGGWIERRADPRDRRVNRVHATDKIEPIVPMMLEAAASLFEDALRSMSKRDIADLVAKLETIKANLAETDQDPVLRGPLRDL